VRFCSCEIGSGQSGTGTGFSASISILSGQYHSTRLHVHVTCCSYQKDKWAKPGNLPDKNAPP